jgi:hypothetical protein
MSTRNTVTVSYKRRAASYTPPIAARAPDAIPQTVPLTTAISLTCFSADSSSIPGYPKTNVTREVEQNKTPPEPTPPTPLIGLVA